MKKHLLLVFFLCIAAAGMAQTMKDMLDSSFVSTDNGTTYRLSMTTIHTYDSACRNDTTTYHYFNTATQQPTNTTRYIYSFNGDSVTRHQSIFQKLDTTSNTFVNDSRDIYTYSADGDYTADTEDTWNGSQWIPATLQTTYYDTTGNITLDLQQTWNAGQQAYINTYQYVIQRNSGGKITFQSSQNWNVSTGMWDHNVDIINVYDSNDFLTSDTAKFVYGGALQIEGYTTHFNNSRGYQDSSLYISVHYNNHSTSYYGYYPDSVTLKQIYQYNYDPYDSLIGRSLLTIYFDSSGNTRQNTETEAFTYGSSDSLVLGYIQYDKFTSMPDGQLSSYEHAFGGYDSSGSPFYSNIYRTNYAYAPCTSLLPVSLLSFTANKNNNNAVLQWKTANETNTASFAIQRSTDGIHFTTIGTVKAAGNSSTQQNYAYTDYNINTLGANKLYYRLAQQDINGTVHNSANAQIDITNGKLSITISPNPVHNSISIYSPVAMANAVIRIADMSGKMIYTSRTNLSAGTTFSIDASAFAKGVYFVTVQNGTDKQVLKLVKD